MYCETIKSAIELEFMKENRINELKAIRNEEIQRQPRNYSSQRVPQIQHVQPRTPNIEKNRIKEFLIEKVKEYFLKYNIPETLLSEINFDAPVNKIFNSGIKTLDFFLTSNPDVGNVDNILSYIIGQYSENNKIIQTIQSY